MTETAVARVARRALLDGRYRWGFYSERTRRYGGTTLSISVYPPQAPRHLRRCARATRHWPVVTPAAAVPTGVAAAEITGLALSLAIAVAAVPIVSALAILARVSLWVRRSTAGVFVAAPGGVTPDEMSAYRDALDVLARLKRAEEDLDAERIDGRRYQDICRECFARVRGGGAR